jgi:hypothetical protein
MVAYLNARSPGVRLTGLPRPLVSRSIYARLGLVYQFRHARLQDRLPPEIGIWTKSRRGPPSRRRRRSARSGSTSASPFRPSRRS